MVETGHVADTFLHISQINHQIIALIVQLETHQSLLLRVFCNEVIDSLAEVVISALEREIHILADDVSQARQIALSQKLDNLRSFEFNLLRLDADGSVVLDYLGVNLLEVGFMAADLCRPFLRLQPLTGSVGQGTNTVDRLPHELILSLVYEGHLTQSRKRDHRVRHDREATRLRRFYHFPPP